MGNDLFYNNTSYFCMGLGSGILVAAMIFIYLIISNSDGDR